MERRTLLGRLNWQLAEVINTQVETARTRSMQLAVPTWPGHRPGSIASPPEEHHRVTLTVERLDDGEVSPYLTEELRVGDGLELRGPIGGYFVWDAAMGGPLLLIAGGSGIVPLMAMLRHRAAVGSIVPARLLYSSRSFEEVIYRDELDRLEKSSKMLEVVYTLTREHPPGWTGYTRRIDTRMLREVAWAPDRQPLMFFCGPTPFVETAAASLVELGHEPARIKTERFGPTGDT
jgi:ferredoxin-NADP reductase